MTQRLILLIGLLVLTFPLQSIAAEAGQFRVGAGVGQIGLLDDPSTGGGNAVGYQALVGYQIEDNLALDISYAFSSPNRVDHSDLTVSGDYYFGDYETSYPHLSAGISFISNRFKDVSVTGDAVALQFGGGLEFELSRNFRVGPEIRYQKAFEAKALVNDQEITSVGDSYLVLLRFLYYFNQDT